MRSIESHRVRTLWLPHCGNPSRVRNAAIEAATGRYLAFLDSDDIWASSKLERQILGLRENSRCRWSYTTFERIDANGEKRDHSKVRAMHPHQGWVVEPLIKLELAIPTPALMAERDLVNEVGRFDEQQNYGEVHDLCMRLAMKGEVQAVLQPLCCVRAHDEHYSRDRIAAHSSWMRLYSKMATLVSERRLHSHCLRMRRSKRCWSRDCRVTQVMCEISSSQCLRL